MSAFLKLLSGVLVTLLLPACSGTYYTYKQTLDIALAETPDVAVDWAKISASNADLSYVNIGTQPGIIMALAYLENGQHKWVSADKALLILEKGRIVRTTGLKQNVLALTQTQPDPLKTSAKTGSWQHLKDWDTGFYGDEHSATVKYAGSETLIVHGHSILVTKYVEKVRYRRLLQGEVKDYHWQNTFWFDAKTGDLLKSSETPGPDLPAISMSYLSRINRLYGESMSPGAAL